MWNKRQKELQFFKLPVWHHQALNFDRVGIDSLRSFLQSLLERHIEKALPEVRSEISDLLETNQNLLNELGEERPEISDQKRFLSNLSMNFMLLVRSAIDGTYQDNSGDFFGHNKKHHDEDLSNARLRADIHILNEKFSDFMRENAHMATTTKRDTKEPLENNDYDKLHPLYMTEEEFFEWIMKVRHLENNVGKPLSRNVDIQKHKRKRTTWVLQPYSSCCPLS